VSLALDDIGVAGPIAWPARRNLHIPFSWPVRTLGSPADSVSAGNAQDTP